MDMIVAVEGQKANITLPDGSKGWINSDSKLSYGSRFNADERVLNLEGEVLILKSSPMLNVLLSFNRERYP